MKPYFRALTNIFTPVIILLSITVSISFATDTGTKLKVLEKAYKMGLLGEDGYAKQKKLLLPKKPVFTIRMIINLECHWNIAGETCGIFHYAS